MYWRVVEHGMEFGWLFIVIFAVLIVFGIVYLASLVSAKREKHGESPVHILKRRYARGEITKEEFDRMMEDITRKIC
jgi:putative membrane protein